MTKYFLCSPVSWLADHIVSRMCPPSPPRPIKWLHIGNSDERPGQRSDNKTYWYFGSRVCPSFRIFEYCFAVNKICVIFKGFTCTIVHFGSLLFLLQEPERYRAERKKCWLITDTRIRNKIGEESGTLSSPAKLETEIHLRDANTQSVLCRHFLIRIAPNFL